MLRTEPENKDYKVNGETVRANLKVNPQKKPLSTAQAMFCKAVKGATERQIQDNVKLGSLQVSFYAVVGPLRNRQLAVKYTIEGEGHVQEG